LVSPLQGKNFEKSFGGTGASAVGHSCLIGRIVRRHTSSVRIENHGF